jgi:hypothetical protein
MEDNIGLDINFNKYPNHGIELRFLDYFDENKLPELLNFFVLLLDYSLKYNISSVTNNDIWNKFVLNIIIDKYYIIDIDTFNFYNDLFKFNIDFTQNLTCVNMFDIIKKKLIDENINKPGPCYIYMA